MNTATLSGAKSAQTKPQPAKPGLKDAPGAPPKGLKPQGAPAGKDVAAKLKTEKMDNPQPKDAESKEVKEYLKAIDRLEAGLKSGEIKPEELQRALNNLEEKILSLSPQQQKKLLKMDFFVQHKIEDLKTFKSELLENLMDQNKRPEALRMLREPQFISLLNNLEGSQGGETYSKGGLTPNQAQPLSTQNIKA